MNAQEFKAWREGFKLTQESVAQQFRVSRTTVQNWESGATPITQVVEMSCEAWGFRLRQEDPDIGPVTLIYTDGPMFINPSRPQRLAMMKQESYPTNAAAVARVQQLWARDDFHNPFIIEKSGKPLWNVVELGRVANGSDRGAPTVRNMLRAIAKSVRSTSSSFASNLSSPSQKEHRRRRIEALAAELDGLATATFDDTASRQNVEAVFSELQRLGKRLPDSLVHNVAQAFVATEHD